MWDPDKLPRAGIALILGILLLSFGLDLQINPDHYRNRWGEEVARSYGLTLIGVTILAVAGYLLRLSAPPAEEEMERTPILIPDFPEPSPPAVRSHLTQNISPIFSEPRIIPQLIGITGGVPARVEIPIGNFDIGRSPECDLVLSSQLVSRKHARIEWDGSELRITDLGSANTTQVNDQQVTGSRILRDGDVIHVVDYQMEVSLAPPHSQDATVIRTKDPDA